MCDYSAKGAKSRPAKKADQLVSGSISYHTRGFVSAKDPSTAVCLLPGTELAFAEPVKVDQSRLMNMIEGTQVLPHQVAQFVQVNKHQPDTYHDALKFPDGRVVMLNMLVEGQRASVLQLPASPKTPAEQAEQQRAEYV